MVDPDREARSKVRAIVIGSIDPSSVPTEPPVAPAPAVPQSARSDRKTSIRPPRKSRRPIGPDENPFGDGVTVLPNDWREQPLN
jgi:hypothetical protein